MRPREIGRAVTEDMTVVKLIERLSQYDGSLILTLSGDYGYGASIEVYDGNWTCFGTIWEDGGMSG